MKGFRVPKEKAQLVKEHLASHHTLSKENLLVCDGDSIIFPIIKTAGLKRIFPFGTFVEMAFPLAQKRQTFREALADILTTSEQKHILSGFDVIGDIAILEIPPSLKKKEKKIAQLVLALHLNIKTVVKKSAIHGGKYRTREVVHLAGKKKLETVYRESGVNVRLHVSKVYFSARLAEERKRIASLVKPGERVLVLFSGVGIYPLVIARNSNAACVYGIELNPVAHRYALENVKLNNMQNVVFIQGDAMKEIKKLPFSFDRIVMPLPKNAEDFLGEALGVAKKGTIIHFYDFFQEKDIPREPKKKTHLLCKKWKTSCHILDVVKCGQYAPYVSRVCVDFKVV